MTTADVDTPDAVMWSIGQIAERDGVSKQAVSKRVKALVNDHGLQVDLDPRGRIIAVNVAAYDHLRGMFGDPSKVQAPAKPAAGELPLTPPPDGAKGKDSYDEAKRVTAWIDAERSKMRFAEEKKKLISATGVLDAVGECGIEIARLINRLPNFTDEITAAAGGDNAHGARVLLKTIAQRLLTDIASALAAVAQAAPELEQEPHSQLEEHNPVAAGE